MTRRPRLLFLAYSFRPAPWIACVRTWNIAKHLSMRGWDVTVVTPHPSLWLKAENSNAVVKEASEIGIKFCCTDHDWPALNAGNIRNSSNVLARFWGKICRRISRELGIEAAFGWRSSVLRACKSIKPGDVDIILATAKPNISFAAAERLSVLLKCPFVMDYRDPWTGDPHPGGKINSNDRLTEAALLRRCAAVTVVSPSWAELIGNGFAVADKTHVISNGYDPEMFAHVSPMSLDHFTIVYAGTLYPPKRVLDPVLQAFKLALTAGLKAKFHYYGAYSENVSASANRLGLTNEVIIHGQVSRDEALSAQKGAGMNVVVCSLEEEGTPSDNGMVTGKIYDCLALKRPILVVASRQSDMRKIIATTGGARCFSASDVPEMATFMKDVAGGALCNDGNPAAYQWISISEKLDNLLRTVVRQTL